MNTNKIILSLSLITSILLAESKIIEIQSITVTGLRDEQKVVDQTLSISKKGKKEIQLDQVIFQKDLLNSISGVRIEQTTSIIGHKTSIRMPSTTSPYYLFLQDNIPVQSSGFFNHNGLAYTTFESANSTEVIKGAGTALYGSDAVAAIINVQSAKDASDKLEANVKLKAGSDGFASGYVGVSDTIDEKSSYSSNLAYSKSDGWREHTSYDRFELNMKYDYLLDEDNDFRFLLSGTKTDASQADSFSDYALIENGSTKASDDSNYYLALEKTDVRRKFDYSRLSAEWNNNSIDSLEIATIPYVRYNRNQYVATWENNLPSNDSTQKTIGILQKNTLDASWGQIIFGFDTEYTDSTQKYNQDFDVITTGWGAKTYTKGALYNYDVSYFAIAPYIHSDYKIFKSLNLSAGLRFDYNSYDYKNNLSVGADSSNTYYRTADRKDDFSHLSPKLSLSYMPQTSLNIYFRYANGFRIPQATRLYSQKVGYEEVNLDSETSNTFEIGVKKEFDKHYIELIAYYMSIDNTITRYKDDTSGLYYFANGDSTINQGIEFSSYSQISDGFGAKLAYSYSKHNYKDDAKYNNNDMAEAPEQTANVRIIYTPTYINGLEMMAEWQYVGSYWMDDDNTKEYEGYNITNLKANYDYSKFLSVFGKVTNLTDERYATSATYRYGSDNYTPGDPRQFYVGIDYKW